MANDETRNSVEFVAFLLWYSFLVFCCVLPTCCAYRRRQMLMQLQREEAEFEQRYFFGGGGRTFGEFVGNGGGINNNQLLGNGGGGGMDEEEARVERTRRITAALKATSFVVDEKDIVKNKEYLVEKANQGDDTDGKKETAMQVDEELGGVAVPADDDRMMMEDQNVLQLPSDGENAGSRLVPEGCAICLDAYSSGDEVIWSPEPSCPHAFHQDCIIPWLAKKEEPKCPCCRQTFCEVEPVVRRGMEPSGAGGAHNNNAASLTTPFGLIPSGFIMRQNISQNGRELIIIPSANLIVSQTVNDQGVVGLRIAERDPPTTAEEEGTNNVEEQIEETEMEEEETSRPVTRMENVNEIETGANDQKRSSEAVAVSTTKTPSSLAEIEMEEIGEVAAAAAAAKTEQSISVPSAVPVQGGGDSSSSDVVVQADTAEGNNAAASQRNEVS